MMKFSLIFLLFFVTIDHSYSQGSLLKSRESGYYTYIYQLTDKESFKIASTSISVIDGSFLHSKIDSFYNAPKVSYSRKLPYGNYLYVTPVKNQLLYKMHTVQNVRLEFINDLKNVQFVLFDQKGREISGATVEIGKGKQVKYDQEARMYHLKSAPKQQVIRVLYQDVHNFFRFEDQMEKQALYNKKRTAYLPKYRKPPKETLYKGYMVFNQPKYKPLDTVKFKTYLVGSNGKAIKDKILRVELSEAYENNGKVITMLHPYREGGYTYDFVLVDTLDMKLDKGYDVILKEFSNNSWIEVYRGNFRYEDYELKAINFFVRADRDVQSPGSPVTLYLSARDENELAVPDGRVDIRVFSNHSHHYRADKVFVPDSLWKTELKLDPVGETKFIIPDSIFPKADMDFGMNFHFLNSNNESRTSTKYLRYVYQSANIESSLKKDSIYFKYEINGKPAEENAIITLYDKENEKVDSAEIHLPAKLKTDPQIAEYHIKTSTGFREEIEMKSLRPDLQVLAEQRKDSLQVIVRNTNQLPFWYTIFSGNKIIRKGYALQLDTILKHSGKRAADVRLNYLGRGGHGNGNCCGV